MPTTAAVSFIVWRIRQLSVLLELCDLFVENTRFTPETFSSERKGKCVYSSFRVGHLLFCGRNASTNVTTEH